MSHSTSKRIAFAVTISWLNRAISILSGLFLVPIMFYYLGKEELGLWFLLINSNGLLDLFGLGIAPIITRRIALARGKSGVAMEVELSNESQREIGELLAISRILLRTIAVFIFFLASVLGYFFINQLEILEVPRQTVLWSWIILCAGYSIGVWVSHLYCAIEGFGYVGFGNLISLFISLSITIMNIVVVVLGGGLLELALIVVVTNLIQRFLFLTFIRKYKPHLLNLKGQWNTVMAKSLVKPSLDYWSKSLGTYTILKADQYFIGSLIGVSAIASYHATYQLVSNLRTLAVAFAQTSVPFIGQMWKAGDIASVHKIVNQVCLSALLIVAIGASFLLVSGQNVIELWLGEGSFIGYGILIIFCLTIFFDTNNVCLIECARSTGKDKYGIVAIIAGILNIILSMILIKPLGLLGVCLATLVSLMLTENWYSLYEPLTRLQITLKYYLTKIIFPIIFAFTVNYGLNLLVKLSLSLSSFDNSILSVVCTIISSFVIFVLMAYKYIFDEKLKNKIKRIIYWKR